MMEDESGINFSQFMVHANAKATLNTNTELRRDIREVIKINLNHVLATQYDEVGEGRTKFHELFNDVLDSCGVRSPFSSHESIYNLLKHWVDKKSANYVEEFYYHFHTVKYGQFLASEIDILVFGMPFEEATGFSVPGGFRPPASPVNPASLDDVTPDYESCDAHDAVCNVIASLSDHFGGRRDILSAIDSFIANRRNGGEQNFLLITAPSGYGKSAIAAEWCSNQVNNPACHIVKHFCQTMEPTSTNVERAIDYINAQVAFAYGKPYSPLNAIGQLKARLRQNPPDGRFLIIWIDGIDEADRLFDSFIPNQLGNRVCLIVSTRAESSELPPQLKPFLSSFSGTALRRVEVSKLSKGDIEDIVARIFTSENLSVPDRIYVNDLHRLSHDGYPMFTRLLITATIKEAKIGIKFFRQEAMSCISHHFNFIIDELKSHPAWQSYRRFFALLAAVDEPMTLHACNSILGELSEIPSFELIPLVIRRWLYIDRSSEGDAQKISFHYWEIRERFRRALGKLSSEAYSEFRKSVFEGRKYTEPLVAAKKISIMMQMGDPIASFNLLCDKKYFDFRKRYLGRRRAVRLTISDYRDIQGPHGWRMSGGNYLPIEKIMSAFDDSDFKLIKPSLYLFSASVIALNSVEFKKEFDEVRGMIESLDDRFIPDNWLVSTLRNAEAHAKRRNKGLSYILGTSHPPARPDFPGDLSSLEIADSAMPTELELERAMHMEARNIDGYLAETERLKNNLNINRLIHAYFKYLNMNGESKYPEELFASFRLARNIKDFLNRNEYCRVERRDLGTVAIIDPS